MYKEIRFPFYTGIALICALTFFGACDNPAGSDDTIPLSGISLNPGSLDLDLVSVKAYTLTVSYDPAGTTQQGLTWSSDNTAVATVSNGMITAGAVTGTALITAVSTENPGVSAGCTVTVQTGYAGAGVNIVFDQPGDETITLGVVQAGGALSVTAPGGYVRYLWYIDGDYYYTSNTPFALIGYGIVPGPHYFTVIVEKADGTHLSKTVTYTVGY
ncbi:MAG: Ig-like domain-containing protein [Treponema sp.]|jgi:hypothetical protein|nr:Ig-like domain-containing protein [Treponema sp.]